MKKIFLIAIISLMTRVSHSQEKFGVFTGLNYSYFTDGFLSQVLAEQSFGLQLGALYEFEINEKINFRPKLSFSQQGDRTITQQSTSFTIDQIDNKLTYLNTSLDFKFWEKVYLIIGPQIGFLLNEEPLNNNLREIDSSIDFGLNLGFGFKIKDFFMEIGIYQGISTILKYQYSSTKIKEVKNGFAKFTLGYYL